MAEVLNALGAQVVGTDPRGLPDGVVSATVAEMISSCDALTLHCDRNASTLGLIDRRLLNTARDGLVLVNTARGGLVDEAGAMDALQDGRLGALCLDVFSEEPTPHLAAVQNSTDLMLAPHAAGYHEGLAESVKRGICEAVTAFSNGQALPHPVPRPA